METIETEGVVLSATPYQEHHHIATLFSPSLGLARIFVRGSLHSRRHSHALVTPLSRGDFLLSQGKGSLLRLRDGVITHPYLQLRESATSLQTACAMARALITTQYPLKAAPALYQLFTRSLDQIGSLPPGPLLLGFYLKLIKHEGLLPTERSCIECHQSRELRWNCEGLFCEAHAPNDALPLSNEEWESIQKIAGSRKFEVMVQEVGPSTLQPKVEQLIERLKK